MTSSTADLDHQDALAEDDMPLPVIDHVADILQVLHVGAAVRTQAHETEPQLPVQNAAASVPEPAVEPRSAGSAEARQQFPHGVPPSPQAQRTAKRDWIRLDQAKNFYKVGRCRLMPLVDFVEPLC